MTMRSSQKQLIWKSHRFRACAEIITTDTKVRLWDPTKAHSYNDVLDDLALQRKLQELDSFWDVKQDAVDCVSPKLVILTAPIDERKDQTLGTRAVGIQSDTLASVMCLSGVDHRASKHFWNSILPTVYSLTQYEEGDENPTSATILFRCPRLSNAVTGVVRVQFRTRNCFAFLASSLQRDMDDIMSNCMEHINLLQKHPLYLLSFIYDYRFLRWTDWFADLWRTLVEIETASNMTHPLWRLQGHDTERQEYLSNSDNLLSQLHALHLELCHSNTVMSFALKLGAFCPTAVAEVEDGRARLGCKPLSMKDKVALNQCFYTTLTGCDSMKVRLAELNHRLNGQINVTFNLIAQRDSKINFAIAKLQVQDSRTVKAIGILTLVFLPATFLATLWSTNLITLQGDGNWQVFLAVALVLTVVVLACWWAYGRISRRRGEMAWPQEAGIDSLPLFPAFPDV